MGTIKRNYSNNILSNGKFDATDLTGTIPTDNINGSTVQTIAGDPPAPANGQIWYNSVSSALKARVLTAGSLSWASGGNLSQARGSMSGGSGAGIQTACFVTGGQIPSNHNGTEEYDGSSWTAGTNFPTGRVWMGGTGTLTAGLIVGGSQPANVDESKHYDGTTWTAGGNLAAVGRVRAVFGIQTAAITAGGSPRENIGQTAEEYDGTSWSPISAPAFQAEGKSAGSASPVSAGVIYGGSSPSPSTQTEEWNGSSWTTTTNLSNGRRYLGGFGTQTAAIASHGVGPGSGTTNTAVTEQYDGSSWSNAATASTARAQVGASNGATTDGLVAAGELSPGYSNATEEYSVSSPSYVNQTISTS
jgi:hypothetical protein